MNDREYNKLWMREYRASKTKDSVAEEVRRINRLREQGRCPHCEMIVSESPGHNCQKPWGFFKGD